jgi:anti-sigma factor RsiW
MTCSDCLESLGAFVDGELSPDEAAQLEAHLATCGDCAAAHQRLVDTSALLRTGLMRYEAPDVLKARIRANLAEPAAGAARQRPSVSIARSAGWQRTAAAAVVVAIASSGLTYVATRESAGPNPIQEQVLSSHIRSLMPGHLTDVASNDQHNVKPWFNGRVNISPNVPRLDSLGYPLVGGRVDYIAGRNVATIVYSRRQHVINVFSWPVSGGDDISRESSVAENGYNIIRARRNGVETWIVSDLNRAELEAFSRLLLPGS